MSYIDVIVLISVVVLVLTVIFFAYILPKIKHEKTTCSSCPSVKRAKRLVKNYKKKNK